MKVKLITSAFVTDGNGCIEKPNSDAGVTQHPDG